MGNLDNRLWADVFAVRFKGLCGNTPYRELSEKLGIGKSTISAYINNERVPKVEALVSIAYTFGVNPMWLMGADVPKYEEHTSHDIVDMKLSDDRQYLLQRIASLPEEKIHSLRVILEQILTFCNL